MVIALDELFGGAAGSSPNFTGSNNLSTYSTDAGGPNANGSFLPNANSLVLGFAVVGDTAATGTLTWNDTVPYSFDKIGDYAFSTSAHRLYLFRALRSSWGATARTATLDVTADAGTGCVIRFAQLSGVDTSGTNGSGAIAQTVSAVNQTSANPALTLAALDAAATSAVMAFFGGVTNPWGGAPETNWTELRDTGFATPSVGLGVYYRLATTDNTVVVTRTASAWAGVAFEIKVPAATTPQVSSLLVGV